VSLSRVRAEEKISQVNALLGSCLIVGKGSLHSTRTIFFPPQLFFSTTQRSPSPFHSLSLSLTVKKIHEKANCLLGEKKNYSRDLSEKKKEEQG
jgi:hypothetical protein